MTQTLQDRVQEWTQGYIQALNDNFYNRQVESYERMIDRDESSEYAKERLEQIKLRDAKDLYTWKAINGRKYIKVVQVLYGNFQGKNQFRNGSVHCFIDKKTGEVYKAASWQNPAKHVRFDMRIIKDREFLHNPDNIDWAGGHLYMI